MTDVASDDLSLEGSLAELERIVRALEEGELTLEESLKAFERGVSLVRRCNALLDGA
ncbi:MAG TPA: exodeoxyribonuclease VII small subunit, partial [Methanotrichaceae archaeon]|nr:exodeoxyribonuclease VII small subunit [Methanotrichaceae archaeon]